MEKDNPEIILEDIQGKFDLVLEGHASLHQEIRNTREELSEKINLVDFKVETLNRKIDGVDARLSQKIDDVDARLSKKIDDVDNRLSKKIDGVAADLKEVDTRLGKKIDAVAADLKAHRADTEAHPGLYRVSEPQSKK
jgi:vacuolar-type H+-ATPase subunit I/STV1